MREAKNCRHEGLGEREPFISGAGYTGGGGLRPQHPTSLLARQTPRVLQGKGRGYVQESRHGARDPGVGTAGTHSA